MSEKSSELECGNEKYETRDKRQETKIKIKKSVILGVSKRVILLVKFSCKYRLGKN